MRTKEQRAAHNAYMKEWYKTHKPQANAKNKRYTAAHKEKAKEWRRRSRVKLRGKKQAARITLRKQVFNAYGGHFCQCCGETEYEFLTIDHINDDGAKHRREIKTLDIYRWLKKNGFPSGFQVLCWNCNCAKGNYKTCPHERLETAEYGLSGC